MDAKVKQLLSQADLLAAKFKQGEGANHIGDAINLNREALRLCQPGHPTRFISLSRLATHLGNRHDQLGTRRDLEEAIVLGREALDLCPQGHPYRPFSLNNLTVHLFSRYNQLGKMQDLDEMIALNREALKLRPQGHPHRPMFSHNLVLALSTRYNQLGAMQDLKEAIDLSREALDLCPQTDPNRPGHMNSLVGCLFSRYRQLGEMQDLGEAIVLGQEALDLCPQGHPHRPEYLINLACCLSTRYDQLGRMGDLDEAIVLDREALGLRPQGHPLRSASLSRLAADLSSRHDQLGTMADLDVAIALDREALALRPLGHPDRSSSLIHLAVGLSTRYSKLGTVEDLDEAITLDREALDLRPQGHPRRSVSLNNLANRLSDRYKRVGAVKDLDEAIILNREALDVRPHGHPLRFSTLNNLAANFFSRYKKFAEMEDLDEAIVLGREALSLCSYGHLNRSNLLYNLAGQLHTRFARVVQIQDKEELFSLYSQLAHATQIVSSGDLSASKAWIRAAEDFRHPTLLLAYETSLRLLAQHLATLPSLPQHLDILKDLTSSLAVDAFSACLRNRSPALAVELLEQGRGVFWNQLTRLRSPLDDVIASGPAGKMLADEFTRLVSLIRDILDSPGADQHERVYHLNLELQKVVTSIRELSGCSPFLLPLPFSDLQRVASGGPVIIVNASQYGCDALIVLLDQDPVHIPLQITQECAQDLAIELHTLTMRARRADVTRELASFLRRIWDQIVAPVVGFLQTIRPSKSRIWWCPTGEFSALPLHAAGPYRKRQLNLADIYVSSYTPTLTALIRARRRDPSNPPTRGKRFVAIGQAKAVGETELFSVGSELDNIGRRVSSLATFTGIGGEESCISRFAQELGKNEWVHLACHGLPNRKQPFESAFALRDGHFTIQRIIGCDLKNPEFAYLSASHTTVGDEESPDEVIHLASAMQFAGFRSVIGTMWAVDDGETNKVTSTFYRHMIDESGRLDHTRAAFALNKTMQSVDIPFDQRVLYIHLGA